MASLGDAKERAQASHEDVLVVLGHKGFLMRPSGSASGGGRGTHYAFVLRSGQADFKISRQEEPYQQTPNVFVDFGSASLMDGGISEVRSHVEDVIRRLGGRLLWDKVSRVDLATDLPGVGVSEFCEMVYRDQYLCRARKWDLHGEGHKTGVTLGAGGDVVCRIYDKLYEVTRAHPDAHKLKLLEERRWGGPQEQATRVEFQLRREALMSLDVDSLADYQKNRAAICVYLVEKWLRFLSEIPDRDNHNTQRTESHPLWEKVSRAFVAWVGLAQSVVRRSRRLVYGDPVRLVKQAAGCLMAVAAQVKEGALISSGEFLRVAGVCIDSVVAGYGDIGFHERYASKAVRVAVLGVV